MENNFTTKTHHNCRQDAKAGCIQLKMQEELVESDRHLGLIQSYHNAFSSEKYLGT